MALENLKASAAWPKIANNVRWAATMSWNKKVPMDMSTWGTDRIGGNHHRDETDCWDLPTLLAKAPYLDIWAYYLDSKRDGVVVADIEPDCPEEIREAFLACPFVYGEVSVSGKGLHLLFFTDDLGDTFIAEAERVRSEHDWFEFLQNHWVCFTGKALAADPGDDAEALRALYGGCPTVYGVSSARVDKDAAELARAKAPKRYNATGDAATLTEYLMKLTYPRTPAYYGNDMSQYEYNRMSWLMHRIAESREYPSLDRATCEAVAVQVARDTFPDALERENGKKRSERSGLTWYPYLAQTVADRIL